MKGSEKQHKKTIRANSLGDMGSQKSQRDSISTLQTQQQQNKKQNKNRSHEFLQRGEKSMQNFLKSIQHFSISCLKQLVNHD